MASPTTEAQPALPVDGEPASPPSQERYIRVQHHPRSGLEDLVLSLDSALPAAPDQPGQVKPLVHEGYERAWAPFKTRADFEVAQLITTERMTDEKIDSFLAGVASTPAHDVESHTRDYQPAYIWHSGRSFVNMKSSRDYHKIMEKARDHTVAVSNILF
jgi:hypothetical protein